MTNPFSSYLLTERRKAARTIIAGRQRELTGLERKWRKEGAPKRQRLLLTRIEATRNNLASWQTYPAEGCPRVTGATTTVRKRLDESH